MKRALALRLEMGKTTSILTMIILMSLFVPGNLFAGSLTLSWDPSTSTNVGGYKLYYGSSTKKYTSSIDTGKSTTYQVTGLTAGATYFFAVTAYNAGKTAESSYSNELSGTVPNAVTNLTVNFTANTTSGSGPLIVAFTPTTTGTVTGWNWNFGDPAIPLSTGKNPVVTYSKPGTYTVSLKVTGPSGSVTATKTGFITVSGSKPVANFSAITKTGIAPLTVAFSDQSTGTISSRSWSFGDGGTSTATNPSHTYSTAGIYDVSLTVTGSNGSSTKTAAGYINVASSPASPPPAGQGPVAVYSFEENAGTIIADASGQGNHGVLREAVRVQGGHTGKGIRFDGINDWITVNDSPSLDLFGGYTLEAWVKPLTHGFGNILTKEQAGGSVYGLYSSEDADLPAGVLNNGTVYGSLTGKSILPLNQWTHLIATYNGAYQRLYVNGVQVAVRAQTGAIKQSNGALRIGGNSIWGEYFNGYIDDIRLYNRALSATEIAKDFTIPTNVSSPAKSVAGSATVFTTVDSNPQGIAGAFKTSTQKNSVITTITIYVDASSTATELVAGIYSDNLGHPGKLLAQGRLTSLSPGGWNKVGIPSINLTAGKPYWIAILGSKGQLKFRDHLGAGTTPTETSVAKNLTSLPAAWMTGNVYYTKDGPISSYCAGYTGP